MSAITINANAFIGLMDNPGDAYEPALCVTFDNADEARQWIIEIAAEQHGQDLLLFAWALRLPEDEVIPALSEKLDVNEWNTKYWLKTMERIVRDTWKFSVRTLPDGTVKSVSPDEVREIARTAAI